MSAAVCVLNKESVAIAADSAITIGNRSAIYNTADKLFALEGLPVGIVIFGSVDNLGVPISVVINEFTIKIKKSKTVLNNLKDYAAFFVDFIEQNLELFSFKKIEEEQVKSQAKAFIKKFKTLVENKYESLNLTETKEDNVVEAIQTSLESLRYDVENEKNIEGDLDFQQHLSSNYLSSIKTIFDDELGELVDAQVTKELLVLFVLSFNKRMYLDLGLSFAGYGEAQIFPAFVLLKLGEVINGKLRYHIENEFEIDTNSSRGIFALAQSDVVSTYLDGVDPVLAYNLEASAASILKELIDNLDNALFHNQQVKILRKLNEDFSDKLRVQFLKNSKEIWAPSYSAISSLPPYDLATFARGLVDMTSFKRKFSIDKEYGLTVGGPTKVAIITKRLGFRFLNDNNSIKLTE